VLSNGVSVSRVVPAPPERIFALLADPRRDRDLDGSGTVRDPVDAPAQLSKGAVFGVWRDELEPVEGGTLVRQRWDISCERVPPLIWGLRGLVRTSMNASLDRLTELVT
jgi:hypothetical protein